MPTDNVLIVLIARDPGLRSSLAARLGMSSADLVTVESFDDSRIARGRRRRVVLIADQAAVDRQGAELEALAGDPRWHCFVLIGDTVGEDSPGLIHLTRSNAAAAIMAKIPTWQSAAPNSA